MDFGDKLKQYRLKEGLSQEQLAEKIGVSRQAITKWETKRGFPDVENMIILAELFKLTLDELVLEEVKKQEEKPVVFESETVYDIDTGKHFDINLGGARKITIKQHQRINIGNSNFPVRICLLRRFSTKGFRVRKVIHIPWTQGALVQKL